MIFFSYFKQFDNEYRTVVIFASSKGIDCLKQYEKENSKLLIFYKFDESQGKTYLARGKVVAHLNRSWTQLFNLGFKLHGMISE